MIKERVAVERVQQKVLQKVLHSSRRVEQGKATLDKRHYNPVILKRRKSRLLHKKVLSLST